VPAGALPFLAWQFDILSPLWQLIAPVAIGVDALTNVDLLIDIDNLIETGGVVIRRQSYRSGAARDAEERGAAASVSRDTVGGEAGALEALGWTQVSLLEGQSRWGGADYPMNQGWAVFR